MEEATNKGMVKMSYLNTFLLAMLAFLLFNCKDDGEAFTYRIQGTLTVDGNNRTYLLNLPSTYNASADYPVVIALHGTGGDAAQFERDYGFTEKANDEQFMIVYPEGVPGPGSFGIRTWNAGNCCGYLQQTRVDDVQFITQLIDHLSEAYSVDSKRVYVTGMSNGAMMAYRLACEIPDRIAAIASVSGPLIAAQPCEPSRAIPILHIHSELDTKVPYAGGKGLAGYNFPSIDSTLTVWAGLDKCNPSPIVVEENDSYQHIEWQDCKDDARIELYLTKDGGHAWPGGHKSRAAADEPSHAFNATDLIWDFFKQHQLP